MSGYSEAVLPLSRSIFPRDEYLAAFHNLLVDEVPVDPNADAQHAADARVAQLLREGAL